PAVFRQVWRARFCTMGPALIFCTERDLLLMLQTLERTVLSAEPTCETRLLDAGDAPALRAFCGAALPLLPAPGLGPALHGGRLLGDFAADALQAAAALLPLFADDPLPAALRAAGFGADGQGAVLTPPLTAAHYTRLRQFLHAA